MTVLKLITRKKSARLKLSPRANARARTRARQRSRARTQRDRRAGRGERGTCDDAAADLGQPHLPLVQGARGAPQGTKVPDLGGSF